MIKFYEFIKLQFINYLIISFQLKNKEKNLNNLRIFLLYPDSNNLCKIYILKRKSKRTKYLEKYIIIT